MEPERLSKCAVSCASIFALALLASSAWAQPAVTQVMRGLDNPRGLAFGPEGALYVAEAGRGGAGPCGTNAANEFRCYGPTGAITRLWRGVQERVATGLPSNALIDGSAATGPHDIAFQGRGGAYITIGLGGGAPFRAAMGAAGPLFGSLIHMAASGEWKAIADVAAFEIASNPGGGPVDANPYGLLAEPGARVVTDAGANALLRVAANGSVSTIAIFPARAQGRDTDSVPTAVAVGPDSAYYVGELTGAPFAAGAANVYRVIPGAAPVVYAPGFKTIIDLAFGPDGSLYVLEHATGPVFFGGPGQLIRVAPNGARSKVVEGLDRPTSVALGPDGAIYVTNHGISPLAGEVLRIEAP